MSNVFRTGRRGFLTTVAGTAAGVLAGCKKSPAPSPVKPAPATVTVPGNGGTGKQWNLSELAPVPDWSLLNAWQETVTAAEFRYLLEQVVTDGTAFWSTIEQRPDRALIRTSTARGDGTRFELRFAEKSKSVPGARYWRKASEMGAPSSPAKPLEGVRIALDAGHIGGELARMEGRYFTKGGTTPVMEGELTLKTAKMLKPLLEAMGAVVALVRETENPLTTLKPETLEQAARESLEAAHGLGGVFTDQQIKNESERLFYRTAEIRARSVRVNQVLLPDAVVCLHFNAEGWGGNPDNPVFSPSNHLHVLSHGCLDAAEFQLDDQRLDVLLRLVQETPGEEIRLCDAVARSLATATGLPAFAYLGKNARRVNNNPYLWARNLLANRIYHCPVVYTEPYVMNSQEVFDRVQAGAYEGEAMIAGKMRRSIFHEYAAGVAEGLAEAFRGGRI
ncbi:MAG: hypothetical protein JWM59_647 [Verrucomicrobiales bacterium]|nr:hypothetical protein [Verrucomicrobiales bacterium]